MALITKNSKITVISGAGISKASGIPTFRGEDGLWKQYSVSDLATPQAFNRNPTLVWEWYRWRMSLVLNTKPNAAHQIIAEWERRGFDICVLTQNVDDLHERAGSHDVIHIHGKILKGKCVNCVKKITWTEELLEKSDLIPKCEKCGANYRPDVVWFGEMLNNIIVQKCLDRLRSTDILIIAGTSGVVYPVAEFPFLAKQQNPSVRIYEFNLEKTPISQISNQTILGPIEETLPNFLNESLQNRSDF